jgi:hypothetical protein
MKRKRKIESPTTCCMAESLYVIGCLSALLDGNIFCTADLACEVSATVFIAIMKRLSKFPYRNFTMSVWCFTRIRWVVSDQVHVRSGRPETDFLQPRQITSSPNQHLVDHPQPPLLTTRDRLRLSSTFAYPVIVTRTSATFIRHEKPHVAVVSRTLECPRISSAMTETNRIS